MDEPRDSATFRMAVGGLGLGLIVALAGICLILAFGSGESSDHPAFEVTKHGFDAKREPGASRPRARSKVTYHVRVGVSGAADPRGVPQLLWAFAAALGGALVGLLLPTPQFRWRSQQVRKREDTEGRLSPPLRFTGVAGAFALIALAVVFLLTVTADEFAGSPELQALAAALGAAVIALMIPTPARFDPE